ncbi:hypothetical protein AALO_G00232400 [Alosa alosa]|uniref:Uncharacterized protein n=1 Tax=Alosa alosa TaxID=278164 RepID=A0AAV6FUE5_9TELE|nr:hypothetical protein AALO_G00232400 [Alosa alosa]
MYSQGGRCALPQSSGRCAFFLNSIILATRRATASVILHISNELSSHSYVCQLTICEVSSTLGNGIRLICQLGVFQFL